MQLFYSCIYFKFSAAEILHLQKRGLGLLHSGVALFIIKQTRCDKNQICLWQQGMECLCLSLSLYLASPRCAWSQSAPQTFTEKPTVLITWLHSK